MCPLVSKGKALLPGAAVDGCACLQPLHSARLSAADCTDVIPSAIDTFFCVV